jgi:hypothetical protein
MKGTPMGIHNYISNIYGNSLPTHYQINSGTVNFSNKEGSQSKMIPFLLKILTRKFVTKWAYDNE